MRQQQRIAVIGAGISGLAAAHRLHELDERHDIAILESSDHIGGVIRSETIEGFQIENGPDSLLTQVPWGLDLCRRIGIAGDLVGTSAVHRGVYTVCRGRLRRVPDGLALMAPQRLWPVMASPILSIRGKLRLACEYFVPPRHATADESLSEFATRRLGREAFDRLVQPLVSGVYMGSPDSLSVKATFPRFVEMEAKHGGLIRAMRAPKSTSPSKTEPALFVAPRGGMEELPRAVAAMLPAGCLRLQCQVQELTRSPDGAWRLMTQAQPGDCQTEIFDAVIVATSAPAAARLLNDASAGLAAELAAIDHTSCVVVNLAFRQEQVRHPLDAHGFVCPTIEQRPIAACTFCSAKYPGRAPRDCHLLRVFLGGASNPQAIDWSESRVKEVVLKELAALLGVRGQPIFFRVQRWRRAMPQYDLGHLQRIDRIEALVEQLPGLKIAGNAYRGPGIAHCIHSGEVAAERVHQRLRAEQQPIHVAR